MSSTIVAICRINGRVWHALILSSYRLHLPSRWGARRARQLADADRYAGALDAWMRQFLDRWIVGG